MMLKKIVLALALFVAPFCLIAQEADLVLNNGNIITIKQKGDRAQAVAIKGQTILATGSNESIRKYIGANTK